MCNEDINSGEREYLDDCFLIDENRLWRTGIRDRALSLGQLLVEISELVCSICTVLETLELSLRIPK